MTSGIDFLISKKVDSTLYKSGDIKFLLSHIIGEII